jgi:hypothetical protein
MAVFSSNYDNSKCDDPSVTFAAWFSFPGHVAVPMNLVAPEGQTRLKPSFLMCDWVVIQSWSLKYCDDLVFRNCL